MTNREYIAKQLSDPDWIDDDRASYISTVEYNIACPYFGGDKRAHCYSGYTGMPTRKMCEECKLEWLEMDVDE